MGSWKKGSFLVLCMWVGLEGKCWGTLLVAIRYPRTAWKYHDFLLEAREGQPMVARSSSRVIMVTGYK